MEIKSIVLRYMRMRLLYPFKTSVGTLADKDFILVEVKSKSGLSGWAETVSDAIPIYHEETVKTNWHMLKDILIPKLMNTEIQHPDDVSNAFKDLRGNYNAKAALDGAIWDLFAKEQGISLAKAIGGVKDKIEVGVSVGIQKSEKELLQKIEGFVSKGYKRIKVKIMPGWDMNILKAIRREFPDIPLMADANCAYTIDDIPYLTQLDEFNLMMVEQPFGFDDLIDHARLQKELKIPICLDESIHTAEDVRKAIEIGSGKIMNLKIGRVGGITESLRIHDLCIKNNIPMWCGGMLEAGIGRAHNIAITSLANFILPGDTAPSAHYWQDDIITPEVTMKDGYIEVPNGPGIGYEPNRDKIEDFMLYSETFHNHS
ncbi:o-succinylbenzoate synthase [Bacillus timonensis]|uniref:o-succinylbenzoate synthase n=1 Tax=Bacillus timonensis TaxID=1033734 RepID=A0A4S3PMW5_9BACI|nr:o-succinylbenzoate synthase [Bacillus timonensis]THE10554.1 o-succinylbenzoate synthase [Bacillus timonensis]